MPAAIQGLRGSGEFTTDFRPKNYRELYTLMEPNGSAPFNALLAMGQNESTDDPEYKNFRDELPERRLSINNGAGYNSSATSLTIDASDDNKYAIAGALIVNASTGEVMRVSSDTTSTTLTVVRNIGGTSFSITDNDELFVAGFAAQEGGSTPTAVTFDATVASNYTQIFKYAFSVTGTLKSTYLRTGSKLDEARTKALKMHMSDIERAFFYGKKHEENGSTNQPTRYTGGLLTQLTNVIDCASDTDDANVMTEEEFDENLISTIFKYGSKQKVAFVGDKVAHHLQWFGKDRWSPNVIDGGYGISFTRYHSHAGDLLVHLHPQFRQIPGMRNIMVIVDFPYVAYRYLEGRDTQLLENRQSPGVDGETHEYMTECGLELLQDKVHAVIKNWNERVAA